MFGFACVGSAAALIGGLAMMAHAHLGESGERPVPVSFWVNFLVNYSESCQFSGRDLVDISPGQGVSHGPRSTP